MKKISVLLLVFSAVFSGCHPNEAPAGSASQDSVFRKTSEEFIAGYLDWRPQDAVNLGFHKYDGKMTDLSKSSIDEELSRLRKYDQQLSSLDSSRLSPENYFDLRILRNGIKNEIFGIADLQKFTRNPIVYAQLIDANMYIKRNFAPLEQRVGSIIAMENQAPKIFENARANLADSLAKPYVELAIQVARGSSSFLGNDLLVALKDVKNDSLMNAFRSANKTAIAAIDSFAAYLEKEKLPKSHNHYAIGRENYMKMLLYSENIQISPDEILAIGMKELKLQQDLFNAAAHIINLGKKPVEVYDDIQKEHPTAADLIPSAKKNMESIRQYLVDKQIVSLPSEVRVTIAETPPYARETSTASMDTPGPFETGATESYYYITPVNPKWTKTQQEDWLKTFNFYTTDVVTIHEVYPGHYTQFLHLKASPTTPVEKIFSSYAFVEGWAHYCEKMMLDEGFGNQGDSVKAAKYKLAQAGDALLRVCRLCVSVKTHTQNMSLDDATKFFMDNWYQGEKPSRQEALRGTFDPGYLFYTVGKLEILKLREDYRQQEGAGYSLKKFHDQILDHGMPPIQYLRELLLKDSSSWNKIL